MADEPETATNAELLDRIAKLEAIAQELHDTTRASMWARFKLQTWGTVIAILLFAALAIGVKYRPSDDSHAGGFEYGISDNVLLAIIGLGLGGGAIVPSLMAVNTAKLLKDTKKETDS